MPRLRPCTTARLLSRGRALVDHRGLAEVELASGLRTSTVRCAQWEGRLVVLAPHPTPLTTRLGDGLDEAGVIRFRSAVAATDSGDSWLAVDLLGWVSCVPASARRAAALEFSERHPTADLLDLDRCWSLLTVDVAEATVRDGLREAVLDADSAAAWLAAA